MADRWHKTDVEYLRRHYAIVDNETLAYTLVRSPQAIRYKAHKLGLRKPKPSVNETYFERINTPDKAYWLGLLWADGSIWHRVGYDSYTLKLELQTQDALLVWQFATAIKSSVNPKITKQNTCRFDLHNYHLCQDLIMHGIVPDKSHSHSFPRCAEKLIPDFLRGVFDGDGSVYMEQNGQLKFSIAGNKALCNFVKGYFGFGGVSRVKNDTYQWRSGGKNVVRQFCDVIYYTNSLTYLERKRQVFKTYSRECV